MEKSNQNIAYIDGANLHQGVASLGWVLDYQRFRVWLADKFGVGKAYIFIGLIPKHKDLYSYLQECGFELIFKEVVYDGSGKAKGNCDADLVLKVARDSYERRLNRAVIVSSDGDYAGLVTFLKENKQLTAILAPSTSKKCSILLKRTNAPIVYINDQQRILKRRKEKVPDADRTAQGSFS